MSIENDRGHLQFILQGIFHVLKYDFMLSIMKKEVILFLLYYYTSFSFKFRG